MLFSWIVHANHSSAASTLRTRTEIGIIKLHEFIILNKYITAQRLHERKQ